ncbi:MAG: tRNA pseudouridine(55) synthase TruB [Alphaproteobacteria bacterium]
MSPRVCAKESEKMSFNGWVILDKPLNMSSFFAVKKVRQLFNISKVGHGGTLDPLASGILPIALGEATKLIPFIMDKKKTYEFTVRWGMQTLTDDVEGDVVETSTMRPTEAEILKALSHFLGDIQQKPPAFSALKIKGERACDKARRGEEVDLAPRTIRIEQLELLEIPDENHATFRVICGKGTYVRSLARDLAIQLGTVGHVSYLRRTAVGPFLLKNSVSFEKMLELKEGSALKELVHSLSLVLDDIPVIVLNDVDLLHLKQGQKIKIDQNNFPRECVMACEDDQKIFHALARIEGSILVPIRVFNI